MADDFCKTSMPPEPHPGPQAALSWSAVVILTLLGQWQGFGSERGLYRYAQRHLRTAFPSLPAREQLNWPGAVPAAVREVRSGASLPDTQPHSAGIKRTHRVTADLPP